MRDNPSLLVADPTKELRAFQVAMTTAIGTKRGRGRGSFIESVLDAIDTFYADVMQQLKAWSAAPPRLRSETDTVATEQDDVPIALVSTALSSQDEPTAGTLEPRDSDNVAASAEVEADGGSAT